MQESNIEFEMLWARRWGFIQPKRCWRWSIEEPYHRVFVQIHLGTNRIKIGETSSVLNIHNLHNLTNMYALHTAESNSIGNCLTSPKIINGFFDCSYCTDVLWLDALLPWKRMKSSHLTFSSSTLNIVLLKCRRCLNMQQYQQYDTAVLEAMLMSDDVSGSFYFCYRSHLFLCTG